MENLYVSIPTPIVKWFQEKVLVLSLRRSIYVPPGYVTESTNVTEDGIHTP